MNCASGTVNWAFAHPYLATALGIAVGVVVREIAIKVTDHVSILIKCAFDNGYNLEVGYATLKITSNTRSS